MRSLFDVSVPIALVDPDHVHYRRVRTWWTNEQHSGWASCPLTQNGFVRIVSQPTYLRPKSTGEAMALLRRATARPEHQFWTDDISLLDVAIFDHSRVLGPRQITDIYLLALATKNGGRFVTLDRGVPLSAARSAKAENLVIL